MQSSATCDIKIYYASHFNQNQIKRKILTCTENLTRGQFNLLQDIKTLFIYELLKDN